MVQIHHSLGNAIIFFMVVCGLWSFFNYLRGRPLGPSLSGSLVIGEILIAGQGGVGVGLFLFGFRPAGFIHLFYGLLAALTLPAAYLLLPDEEDSRQESLQYTFVCLFIVGLAIRAMTTA
ncbi:MAG: hypothetical protein GXP41_05250 [Chloroflexi bacterium]|nr:hypothetical protein [Chloroflexota bacterium]